MNNSKISWYILEDEDFIQDNEFYLGSFSPDTEIKFKVQVWNNRYGKNNVESIPDARLAIYFDSIEDSMLLKYCSVSLNGSEPVKMPITLNKGLIEIGLLTGTSNNGLDSMDNVYNFKNIEVIFNGFPVNLKNGIKNMYLDIEMD